VGASRSARPGVTSLSLMAQPVRLYLPRGRGAPPQPRPSSARRGLALRVKDRGIISTDGALQHESRSLCLFQAQGVGTRRKVRQPQAAT